MTRITRTYMRDDGSTFVGWEMVTRRGAQSFWDHVPEYPRPYACWAWSGAVNGQGYGQYGAGSKLAHRLVYEAAIGPIPPGLVLDHTCHDRLCVNPRHLEPVTVQENTSRHRLRRKPISIL